MSKKKKVLFVATVVKKHINVFHLPYLQWFQEQGYETHVCARDDFDGEECIIPYCDVHYDIPFERSPISGNNIKAYKELKRIIDENEYEIIHCHTPVAAMLTRLAAIKARKKGTKVIYTAHGFHFFKGAPLINWLVYYPVEWVCSWFTDVLITMNQEDYQLAKKGMRAKKTCLVNGVGVNLNKFTPISQEEKLELRKAYNYGAEEFILIYVGELSKRKNQNFVIDTMKEIEKQCVHSRLLLVGEGKKRDEYEEQIKRLKLENHIELLGFRKDISQLMQIADVAVSAAKQEGLPVNILEAMATGLPVIVTNCRGNRDLVSTGENGYIVNSKNEFENKVTELFKNNAMKVEYGRMSLQRVKCYEIENVLNEVIRIYSEGD